MKKICSFCGTIISPGTSPEDPVSHGVCKPCYARILEDDGFDIRLFLDMLEAPVILVDDDVNVLAANSLAIAVLGKPVELVRGTICGDVIECVNAFLPEGCGKTPYCPDCTIRSTVNETYKTGKNVTRRPAAFTRRTGNARETKNLLITTRKDRDIVLLRLEFDKAG